LRRIVQEEQGLYRVNPADGAVIAYYAHAIAPLIAAAQRRQPLEAAA